ncbi:MAG: hypothetical protein JJE30_17325 [Desulfuromonadales bacterium]|nr:hypothetical protein [Desulfuromonadales bacterium]
MKALKRLENEQTARKPDSFKIDAEILKSGSSRRFSSIAVILAAIAVFACGGSAVYFFLKRDMVSVQPSRTSGTAIKTEHSDGSVTLSIPAAEQSSGNQVPVPETVQPMITVTVPDHKPAATTQQTRVAQPPQTAPPVVIPPESKPVFLPPVPAAVPVAKSVLKVEGIAVQDGGAESLAVVNGTTVSRGSVIEGARVEEIQKDWVRFNRNGESFYVVLDKLN